MERVEGSCFGGRRQGKAGEFGSVRKASCLCSAVMCSQEARAEAWLGGGAGGGRGGEQARVISTHSRPSGPTHRGEGQEREKKKKKDRSGSPNWGMLLFFFLPWTCLTVAFTVHHPACHPPPTPTPHLALSIHSSFFFFFFFFK